MQTLELEILGMTCKHCVQHVTQALTETTGVNNVVVNLDSGRAAVTGENLNEAALIEAVDEAGYEAAVVE